MKPSWVAPKYSNSKVDAAGAVLASTSDDIDDFFPALMILGNWRGAHSFPLNTFQTGLRRRARSIYPNAAVAQRLKRVPSIIYKLRRIPGMKLSRMQDIGGCRAVVDSVPHVLRLRQSYLSSDIKHKLVGGKDYIEVPKTSGYRGVHLIYRYHSDRVKTYNGLQVELQLRSRIQHAWATAVEIVGTFLDQSLKSSEGSEEWLYFFALTGSAFALLEKTSPVEGHPPKGRLKKEIRSLGKKLAVAATLTGYREALKFVEEPTVKDARYYLLSLDPHIGRLEVRSYKLSELEDANDDYLLEEKRLLTATGAQAVLVAADSLSSLKRLYPNYFLDTEVFLETLAQALDTI